jgi:hypothetical protein
MKKIILQSAVTVVFVILDILLMKIHVPPTLFLFSSLLFSPLHGGIAGAVITIFNPNSNYIMLILLTIIVFSKGLLIGVLWKFIHDKKQLPYQITIGIIALLPIICKVNIFTVLIVVITVIFLISDIYIAKISNAEKSGNFVRIYFCIAVTTMIAVSLELLAKYDNFDFEVILQNFTDTLLISAIQSYFIVFILNVYKKLKKNP